ncbi:MAG: NADH-quinone oxidoreductase subunit N, partial [Deltaproteobacteria bacterium]|nr:NADH-quinone oxidoreductase subunit N [Deltaproteobacteria bacterium]
MDIGIIDIITILPEMIIIFGACAILLIDFTIPDNRKCVIPMLSLATVLAAAVTTGVLSYYGFGDAVVFTGMFSADGYATFFKFILYTAAILTILLSIRSSCKCPGSVDNKSSLSGEYYVLILFALSGMMVMASGRDLLSLYIGMELMSLPIYALVAFKNSDKRSIEGAMKYVILGAFSSAVMLFGISLIYGFTGTTELSGVADAFLAGGLNVPAVSLAVVMLVAGFGFKIAGVPFHMWAPDAYEGAPTPITAFMSTASKAAAFAMMLRVFMEGLYPLYDDW